MLKSFRIGGIHPPGNKISKDAPITTVPLPDSVTVPLSQHIGAPAEPCVGKGDYVKAGQLIGQAAGFVSANVHSPVSGQVTAVDSVPDAGGIRRIAVTIRREGDEWADGIDCGDTLIKECYLTDEEIIARITAAGIVGMGGATFPTQVKLSVPPGKRAEYLIVNGAECEPYLTADYRTMLERGAEVLVGIDSLCRALGVTKAFSGSENNKPLIQALLGREVPSGGLPIDVGAVVQNIGTAFAVYEAVQKNKPLVERVVTVTGKTLAHPANLLVRIGTPIRSLIELCGGMPQDSLKVINGGPMMGRAVSNIDAPVTKGTSGVVIMRNCEALRPASGSCIKCAKCVSVCPMALEPYLMSKLSQRGRYDELEPLKITDCIECGSCAYTCPAALPLLDYIRLGKSETIKRIRARKS